MIDFDYGSYEDYEAMNETDAGYLGECPHNKYSTTIKGIRVPLLFLGTTIEACPQIFTLKFISSNHSQVWIFHPPLILRNGGSIGKTQALVDHKYILKIDSFENYSEC